MNLALLGFATVATFIALIMTKRLSAVVALIAVPILFGLFAQAGDGLGEMVVDGILQVAPIALLLSFAILFFGIMMDAGLFDPLVRRILHVVGNDPLRISIGTAALSAFVSVDGDGTTTALIVITALLPVYRSVGMNPLILGTLLGLANAVMNWVPWGGPSARAAAALNVDLVDDLFLPLLPAMAAGLAATFALAWRFGISERRRLGWTAAQMKAGALVETASPPERRPHLFWPNLLLTVGLMVGMFTGLAPLPVLMMGAFAIAVTMNYPGLQAQRERIEAHAGNVVMVVVLIFAAGSLTGILNGTGMLDAMARSLVAAVPDAMGPYLAPVTAALSLPLTFVMSNDAYYFGIVPVLAETASSFGIAPEVIARASMMGQPVHQLSPLLAPVYLACGLLGLEVADVQRFALKYAALLSLVLFAGTLASGAIPLPA
ncbi:CitMHS family transporter [Pelagerythrobacter rhizovicinus]|uniref:Citrate transporter n=1 Tax=Pelagerythrobacter rhizovicinus TaxID=2268576 RepID=A0A4Q2KIH9_9SPHN|nr:citrate:proton symporter [Pelagerythrobacter rhizovicinus]RXZ64984.1 citrate transporter [Pelagerythrobacter rhizovicinus]